jgi:hypothetical protein
MKIVRTIRTQSDRTGLEITFQTLTGETHSVFGEREELVGKMLDKIRIVVTETLNEIERLNDADD